MTQEQLKQFYLNLIGTEQEQWHTFFADTPEEQSILVPGCSFRIEDEGGIYRGIVTLPNQETVVVQDDEIAFVPDKMQRAGIIALLDTKNSISFMAQLLVGRILESHDECDVELTDEKLYVKRCNLELEADNAYITVKQNGEICKKVEILQTEAALNEMCDLLLDFSMPAMAFIGQEELLEELKERYYPIFEGNVEKQMDFLHDNSVSYHVKYSSPSDDERFLWIIIEQYSVTVGMNGNSLCDDIGLHIDGVSKYVDAIMQEKTILITKYKDQKHFDNGDFYEITWQSAVNDPQELENKFAKMSKGLGKLTNKGKIVDIFSWNGTYSAIFKL